MTHDRCLYADESREVFELPARFTEKFSATMQAMRDAEDCGCVHAEDLSDVEEREACNRAMARMTQEAAYGNGGAERFTEFLSESRKEVFAERFSQGLNRWEKRLTEAEQDAAMQLVVTWAEADRVDVRKDTDALQRYWSDACQEIFNRRYRR